MGLNDQPLFLFLAELLCQPHHLVGIIQSPVWLSCFTGYFSPGLIIVFTPGGVVDGCFDFYISLFFAAHFGNSLTLSLPSHFDPLLLRKCAIGEIYCFMSYLEWYRLKCY